MTRLTDLVEDPRVVTATIATLMAAALWVASWSAMSGMAMMGGIEMAGTAGADWSAATIGQTALMWVLMMAAMMLPAMTPVMAIYAGLVAREDRGARLALRIGLFTSGYFLLWALVSVLLALAQLGLRDSALFTMMGTRATPTVAGLLLIAAGLYQFTRIKHVCLAHCRHPLTYLLSHWREGLGGAFLVGGRHGLYCVGCCIAFMGLMFVFGAMTLWWMAVIAAYFLAEKIMPAAERWSPVAGVLLCLAGSATLAAQLI